MFFDVDIAARVGEAEIVVRIAPTPGLTVLFGPSGVGKTSVLNMIAGLIAPARGVIRIGDALLFDAERRVNVAVAARRAGYVFQDSRLFPHLRVCANLLYGARGAEEALPGLDFDAVVALLDIATLLGRWPRTLSGGEARRVAIGRALLSAPRFLLLDEPLASLDAARREPILRAIEHLRDSAAMPILMVTHDAEEAARLATQTIAMGR